MHTAKYRSISDVLSEFLAPIKGYKFKRSESVISDLINMVVEKLGGMDNLQSLEKTNSFIDELLKNGTGIFKCKNNLVIVTRFGAINESSLQSKVSLNTVDSLIKMLEHKFDGKYPGSYAAGNWSINIVDSKFGCQTKKEPSIEWQRFNLIKQFNDVMYESRPDGYRYLLSLVEILQNIKHSERLDLIKDHIKNQLSGDSPSIHHVEPSLLKYLLLKASSSYETLTYEMIDTKALAESVFTDHMLLLNRPLLHDAIAISSGNDSLLSVTKLFNKATTERYITIIKEILTTKSISDPNLEPEIIQEIGEEMISKIHSHVREKLLYTELHEELAEFQMGMR
ncbi:hypothetical protein [Vibrio cholerae]|uniref:hypothetical protein n=1 Tax=Vibrio cholerae TaxID=666 RepID=UPI0030158FB0